MVSAPSMNSVLDTPTRREVARGGRLVTTDGVELPLVAANLAVDAKGGLARVVLTQTFENRGDRPVQVEYLLPMPADGVVSGFTFTIGDERVVGEVQDKRAARATYEQALIAGRTAALLEQTRSSVFQQEVGNIPPQEAVHTEIIVDQPLRWLDDAGAWEWRFPTVVGPRYQGAPGRVPDADRLAVDVSERPLAVRMGLEMRLRDPLEAGARPTSPSHALHFEGGRVRLAAEGGARLDRDVVVQWPVAALKPGVTLDVARPAAGAHGGAAFGLLTLVPPAPGSSWAPVARDLVVLIDTSGSMGGEPLAQARRVVSALIDTLSDRDRVELIAFDYAPRRFAPEPIVATRDGRKAALAWLDALQAGGGTEMRAAVQEALRPLRADAQRQVVLVTDGYIGFEQEIVEEVRRTLPAGCRLHTVGVGSSVNRSLTEAAARAGAGLEVVIAPGEDPERAARRLVARTDRPVVTDLVVEGEGVQAIAPVRLPDLFAGAPAQICVRLGGAGGKVRVRGRTAEGVLDQTIDYPGLALGEGPGQVAARFARERVADLEAHRAAGGDRHEIDAEIERLGLDFQVATRRTSWVAVSKTVRVEPGTPAHHVRQPHEAPEHVDLEAVGLRAAAPAGAAFGAGAAAPASQTRSGALRRRMAPKAKKMEVAPPPPPSAPAPIDDLEDAESLSELMEGALRLDDADEDAFEAATAERADLSALDDAPAPGAPPAPEPEAFSATKGWGGGAPEDDALRLEIEASPRVGGLAEEPTPDQGAPAEARRSAVGRASSPRPSGARDEAASAKAQAGAQPAVSAPEAPAATSAPGSVREVEAAPVKRTRRGLWAWILLALAALAALWWLLRPAPKPDAEPTGAAPERSVDVREEGSGPTRR